MTKFTKHFCCTSRFVSECNVLLKSKEVACVACSRPYSVATVPNWTIRKINENVIKHKEKFLESVKKFLSFNCIIYFSLRVILLFVCFSYFYFLIYALSDAAWVLLTTCWRDFICRISILF